MSMHEIEGLVEDSVHVVAKSDMKASVKRDFLFNLYRFQAMFDTGYTHFRLIDTLLELKFTYRIPLEQHPDYQMNQSYFDGLDVDKTYWLPSEIGKQDESVYAKKEDDGIFLYPDAGSEFWQRLCRENILPKSEHKAPKEIKTSHQIKQLLQEADEQKDSELIGDWYALLIHLLGIELGEEEGFPRKFTDFIKNSEIQEIKEIGHKNKLFSKKRANADWGELTTPSLKEIEDFETDTDRLYSKKWLLDFKADEDKLIAEYNKAITPDPLLEKKLQIVPEAVTHHLGLNHWKLVWNEPYDEGHKWLYYHLVRGQSGNPRDTDLHLYFFLDMNTDLKMLYPKIGVQNGLLLRWQEREVEHRPESVHFLESLISFIDEKEWDTNKSLHDMGGWKFNMKQTEKTLRKHIDNLFDCFKKYGEKVLPEFEKPLFDDFQISLKEAIEYREKVQQTHRFFLNQIEVYLVYAIYHFEKGKKEKAHKLAKQALKMAKEKKHPVVKDWIAAAESILTDRPKLNELLSFERNYF